ncbi:MAG: hypothetical protein KJ950_02815 [Proteobacteria bacterium]|nr:hypothetical protein [Pseudomonadota bacterium]MBU1686807.1 hypothetical protein [Pseudomonadota bacterium]
MKFQLSRKGFLIGGIVCLICTTNTSLYAGEMVYRPVKVAPGEMETVSRLGEWGKSLDAREKSVTAKEAELATLDSEVEEKLARLLALQQRVQLSLDLIQAAKDKRFKNLIKTYSTMSPSKLAPLLGQMDDATVAEILGAMKPDEVAKILPKLDSQQAVSVSRVMGMLDLKSQASQ